jgi:phage gp29-like protein
MSLFDSIRKLVRRVPEGRETVGTALGEPPSLAQSITADRVASILRQAEGGETLELFALYREIIVGHAHTQNLVNQRKLNVLTKTLNIVAADDENPADVAAARAAQVLIRTRGWMTVAMNHLLNGHLYPVAVLEQCYRVAGPNPFGLSYVPAEFVPVPYHLLDFTTGQLKLWLADETHGQRTGNRIDLVDQPHRYVVHRGHLLTNIPDNWGGPMRATLFWWLFAVMDRDWWVRFLDRYGAPFIVGRYDTSDQGSKSTLTRAFSAATRLFGLVVSKETDINVHAVNTSSHGEAFERMQAFANAELSKLILGQTMTVTAQAGGLGGAQASVQENVQGSIEAFDLAALAETVNTEIIAPFLRINGLAGRAELQVATDTAAELRDRGAFLETARKSGLEITDEGITLLNKMSGLPLQRAAAPVSPFQLSAMTAEPVGEVDANRILRRLGQPTNAELDALADRAAVPLAAAFRGRYAPVRAIIEASTSAEQLERTLSAFFADLPPGRTADLTEQALVAFAATAAANSRTP